MTTGAPRVSIIGAGRAGCSLFDNLQRAGVARPSLSTRRPETAEAARAEGFDVSVGAAHEFVTDADIVLLAVSDAAVESVAQSLVPAVSKRTVVAHLSGSLALSSLDALANAGVSVGSLHVLVSMPTRRTSLEGGWAGVEGIDEDTATTLTRLAESLGMRVLHPKGDRARYHAAACLVGNYPQVLMEAAVRLLAGCGIPAQEGRAALGSLLVGASTNVTRLSPADALTGPVSRGDVEVVRRHLEALGPDPEVEMLYRAGALIASQLVRERLPEPSELIARLVSED